MELLGSGTPVMWALFMGFVLGMLALDLGVFHRREHAVGLREAAAWSAVWVALAFVFAALVQRGFGPRVAMEYVTGYLVEKALAVDNLFVFVAVFSTFGIPPVHQHRVLYWGVLGALVMRALFIFLGAALLERFHWTIYLFGAFLGYTGGRMLAHGDTAVDLTRSWMYRLVRRWVPATDGLRDGAFFVFERGRHYATPLFFALVLIELVDLLFALDSIPAIFAITSDPFIVFTSNIFAILGLRSMYFLLADLVPRFVYLRIGLSAVLMFVGAKMLLLDLVEIPIGVSLGVVAGLVAGSIVVSLLATRGRPPPHPSAGSPLP